MKTTIVPAQVTTIEDRIAGKLSLQQLGLLLMPLLFGSILYVVLPPFYGYRNYKLVIYAVLLIICATLAIRIKGQLLFTWCIRIGLFASRPRYFVYTKQDNAGRSNTGTAPDAVEDIEDETATSTTEKPISLTLTERLHVEQLLSQGQLRFTPNKKGGLYVVTSEAQQEG